MKNTKLRTPECWDLYQAHKEKPKTQHCFLCCAEDAELIIQRKYKHWYICENQFPYDAIATKHHLLVPYSHTRSPELLSNVELGELYRIIAELNTLETYDSIMVNFTKAQTHAMHLHFHLLEYKRV